MADFGGDLWADMGDHSSRKVRKLALAGNIGFTPDYQWHSTAKLWRTPLIGELSMMTLSELLFKGAMKSAAPSLTPEYWHGVYALSLASPAAKRTILRQYRAVDTQDFSAWEPKLLDLTRRVPMLVLWGDRDEFIASSFADRFGAQEVQHHAQYGHWIAVEAPDEMATKLAAFFG